MYFREVTLSHRGTLFSEHMPMVKSETRGKWKSWFYRRTRHKAGMTLLEVMVASLIMAIGAVAIFGLGSALMRQNTLSNRVAEATRLAENRVEELIGMDLGSVTGDSRTVGGYTLSSQVAANARGEKFVRVRAAWQSIDGDPHEVDINTILTE
jgi:prepilin-type N-terminal cleavage/methylation domain-containing protein